MPATVRAVVLLLSLCTMLGAAAAGDEPRHNQLPPDLISEGWIRLFDGETFFGWKPNNDVNWRITDGVVHADAGEPGLLLTTSEFADYELRCDFRLAAGGNSGIFLRSLFQPKDPATDCYELNMCDSHPAFPTGSLVGVVKPDRAVSGEGDWHTYHVAALRNRIVVRLDDQVILSYDDPRPAARRRGLIGLQKNAGLAEYRNVFLKPLGGEPLFNGRDLSGWRVVPGGASEFTVADRTIHVRNGRGFLETDGRWGDFVFQADVRTNGKHLNSGIFFRAMDGTAKDPSNGYETQIHNAWKGDDRAQPLDFGTGGIHRRQPARRVVSDDFEWLTLTIAASGPHIATWVNGEQVADWTDERPPHENPRQGRRSEAGRFSLQGHDPTTDLSFRNLRVAELPPLRPALHTND